MQKPVQREDAGGGLAVQRCLTRLLPSGAGEGVVEETRVVAELGAVRKAERVLEAGHESRAV